MLVSFDTTKCGHGSIAIINPRISARQGCICTLSDFRFRTCKRKQELSFNRLDVKQEPVLPERLPDNEGTLRRLAKHVNCRSKYRSGQIINPQR